MVQIDRRAVIGAAGASVLVAACDKKVDSKVESAKKSLHDKSLLDMTGVFPNFGHPVTNSRPDPLAQGVSFDPKYVCVVYLKMESNGEFTVRHGYEPYPGDPIAERKLVENMLKSAATGAWAHTSAELNKRREHNFDNFSQNSQQRVWFFVDNKPAEMAFEDRNGKDYVIRFAPMSGVDPENKLPANANRKHYPNNAFFNINIIDNLQIKGLQGKKLISLDCWNTNIDGEIVRDVKPENLSTHYLYAINVHLKLAMSKKLGPNQWLPMIVDPDGGNMGQQP